VRVHWCQGVPFPSPQASDLSDEQLQQRALTVLRAALPAGSSCPQPTSCSTTRLAEGTERLRGARPHLGLGATPRDFQTAAVPLKGRLCFAGGCAPAHMGAGGTKTAADQTCTRNERHTLQFCFPGVVPVIWVSKAMRQHVRHVC
jgi:hypothetical protein